MDQQSFDVVVIGGGINGASAAQQLTAAGYRVALFDKGDFGSGSTSRSGRLLHCGLRYFETPRPLRDFLLTPRRFLTALKMAKQSMVARQEFVAAQPQRASEIQLSFPLSRQGPYRPWQMDAAFKILAGLGPKDLPLNYRRITPGEAKALPLLSQIGGLEELESIAVFSDYIIHWPERICLDCIFDARRMGALIRNYTQVRLKERTAAGVWQLELEEQLDAGGAQTATIEARSVLNTAGIWIDQVNAGAAPAAERRILGTKGTMIALRLPFDCGNYAVSTLNSLGEPFYVLPWKGLHYLGPTETVYDGDLDSIHPAEEEIDFILQEAQKLMPTAGLTRDQVLFSWAGVRPLTYDAKVPEGKRSRELHDLTADGLPGVLAMTAGPVMTYRSAGAELLDAVRRRTAPSGPTQKPHFGAAEFSDSPNAPPFLADEPNVSLADLRHAAAAEQAVTLYDLLYRRTGLGWSRPLSAAEVQQAATAAALELGWNSEKMAQEVERYKVQVRELHGIVF